MSLSPSERWRRVAKVFATSFLQVGLITAQIKAVQYEAYIVITLISIGISLCWFFNVQVAIGNSKLAKLAYVVGAAIGAVLVTKATHMMVQ